MPPYSLAFLYSVCFLVWCIVKLTILHADRIACTAVGFRTTPETRAMVARALKRLKLSCNLLLTIPRRCYSNCHWFVFALFIIIWEGFPCVFLDTWCRPYCLCSFPVWCPWAGCGFRLYALDCLLHRISKEYWGIKADELINLFTVEIEIKQTDLEDNVCIYLSNDWITTAIEPPRDKTNEMTCAPSKNSDQPGHSPSLIRVFAVRMKVALVLSYP